MRDVYRDPDAGWIDRLRARRGHRRAMRADRRARRRARLGGRPDGVASRAAAGNYRGGGYFKTKPPPKE